MCMYVQRIAVAYCLIRWDCILASTNFDVVHFLKQLKNLDLLVFFSIVFILLVGLTMNF